MLTDKVALVTGGSRGIGAAIVAELARQGADVALTYARSAEQAARVVDDVKAAGRRGLAIRADSGAPGDIVEAVEMTAQHFGRLDVLVNNAGIFVVGPVEGIAVDEIDNVLAVHVRAAVLATQAAVPYMTDGGSIISIGSNLADRVPAPGLALYAASKAALTGLTRGFARELGGRGITVNVVHPGPTDTDMNPADGPGADPQREQLPLGRFGRPEGVASMVAHLAGSGGRSTTGASILVDSGANV